MAARLFVTTACLSALLGACAATPPPAPIPDACTWLKQIVPDAGFETRLTRSEKQQILSLDSNITKFCR